MAWAWLYDDRDFMLNNKLKSYRDEVSAFEGTIGPRTDRILSS